ncbi:MAG: hypothetical protein AAF572_01065 [Cyanobacteria bacterium P01_B01_bin.77]
MAQRLFDSRMGYGLFAAFRAAIKLSAAADCYVSVEALSSKQPLFVVPNSAMAGQRQMPLD